MRALATAVSFLLAALPAAARAQVHTIVVDAGHGGADPGGTGNGMQEKNVVLDVTEKLRDLLEQDTLDTAAGGAWNVLLTRGDDSSVSLAARSSYANSQGADRFISIHSNAFGDPQANGTETFAYANGSTAANLRNLIQEEMIRAWGLRNRGNKTANFHVLRETAMPAALHELAFITNATDAQKLASPQERQKAAEAHLIALQRHYDLAPFVPGDEGGDGGDEDTREHGMEEPPAPYQAEASEEGAGGLSGGCAAGRGAGGDGALLVLAAALLVGRRRRR